MQADISALEYENTVWLLFVTESMRMVPLFHLVQPSSTSSGNNIIEVSYASGAVRLSALSKHQVLYIMTHDSIGLGEDGATHQPIETLACLRATPNITNIRPADGNEVSGAYLAAIKNATGPTVLILTRQNLPHLEGSSIEKSLKGAYVLNTFSEASKVILVATGSEVSLAVDSAKELLKNGIACTVVSMPSWELFEQQTQSYKESVFAKGIPVVSIEAMSTLGWSKYAHYCIGIDTFGASGPAAELYKKFGLTPDCISKKVVAFLGSDFNLMVDWKVRKIDF